MKEFFYLDTELLQSYVSQIYKGLITNIIDKKVDKSFKSVEDDKASIEAFIKTDIGISNKLKSMLAFQSGLSSEFEGGIDYKLTDGTNRNDSSNEFESIYQKAMKDDLFDAFEEYLNDKGLISYNLDNFIEVARNTPQLYFKIKANFNYINLDRIDNMFQDEYSNVYRILHPNENYPNADYFSSVRESIRLLRKMIPYHTFLYTDKYIVLINEKYLRVDKNTAGFKFNPNATVVGRIRKTTLESPFATQQPKVIETLNKIQAATFDILFEKGFVSKQPEYIIDPIAIYYE